MKKLLLLIGLLVVGCGPQYVRLYHEATMPISQPVLGPVQVLDVEDTRSEPYILSDNVEVDPETNSVAQEVKLILNETLQNAGIRIGQSGLFIKATVLRADLLYTYMHVQGTFIVQVQLVSSDGGILWSQVIEGADGAGGPFGDLYTASAQNGLIALYNQLLAQFRTPQFQQVIGQYSQQQLQVQQ